MLAPMPTANMDNFSKAQLWLAAAALLAAVGCGAGAGSAGRRALPAGDSILDIIDTEHVQRVLAARRRAAAAGHRVNGASLSGNELGEGARSGLVTIPEPPQEEDPEIPSGTEFRKILKSSKNALVVTTKEYLKEDWCKTEPLVQKIRENGCLPTQVINSFCYGQCNSFYIPKGPRRRDASERPAPAFKSCAFCRPKRFMPLSVTLRCPGQVPPLRRRRLQRVQHCKCLPVAVN